MHVYYFRYPPACRFRRVILDLYMFGHRVAEIGALQAPFDNRYSWFQIKSVRDARTKSDPRQCVHLCIAIFTYHRLYQNDFSNPFPSIVSHNPRFCHTPVTLFLYHHTVGYIRPVTRMYIHPSHTLSTFLKTHYITHPTHPRASGVCRTWLYFHRICAVSTTRCVALRNSNVPRKSSRVVHSRIED